MKLDINLKEESKIRMLEDEILELKQRLELAQAGSVKLSHSSDYKSFSELFGVVDSDFNLLSVNNESNHFIGKPQNKLKVQKCYSAFRDLNQPCDGCTISTDNTNKLVWYFLQPQLSNKNRPCNRSIITPANLIEPFELTLKETDLFYEQLFESTGDALLIIDCKGRILKFTKKLCEMLSYSEEEFSKLTIFDIDDPTNSLSFDERACQIKRDKGAIFETDLISKSGKLIPVESSSSPIRYHSKTVFFVTFRNIEERLNAQKELLESEIRFRTLVENANDLVMRFDREHRHVFVNSASQQVLGIPPQNFIGKTHQEMGFPDDLCLLWEEEMDKVFESGITDVIDFSIQAKGRDIDFEWQLIPEFDTEDEIPYLLAVARDVSKRTMSEKALEEALKTKDKFFSIIAHDLRNPFGSLRTLSEYLQNSEDLTKEEIQEFAEIIHASACQGYDLLENLLEWSRSQRGSIKWQPQEFDLVELIDSNIKLIQANIHKKQIHLNFQAETSQYVFADKYMIDTVIRNLLANAVKFTYMNGNIDVFLIEKEKHYCVSIKDDGKGISKNNQKKLFHLDNQYSSLGTAMETGTGLGLILCKEFIDINNGEIWVESEGGKGSCFSFTVPKK
ncbi:PAS domain-containing sensor histidine kinase [Ancylomarina euxinus]|uniref:histidine kinase n=1 Tax=Ancylomarina euxinus TaxID=2283627 RepID=A0A425Y7V1_9BACT|nr:PAS domain-containing sensor histidine kinase [Ancylomarina euxinus]MCZ4693622.1 PAS domain-containing sensor histidine kinase [Ancylomarina euxinus]MUP13850.1 PAS domain S-box protein [Ancylomarina euxinus]RRG24518.1 PAS domain-containing sensor histidine kinase [Ancylomarina euxinus]